MPDGELSSSAAPDTREQRTDPLTQHKRSRTRSQNDATEPHQRIQQPREPAVPMNDTNQRTR